jgi:hypothetical protein
MTSAVRLDIPVQKKITSYLNIAYPMLFLMPEPKLKGWYYERFVHIFAQRWFGNYLRTDYTDSSRYFGDLLERHACSLADMHEAIRNRSIVAILREATGEGFAANVFTLDQFFLPEAAEYQQEHKIHELLVTGYDDRSEKLHVIGYTRSGKFDEYTVGYAEFEQAFESGLAKAPDYLTDALHLIKRRPLRHEYRFDPTVFVRELEKLVYSLPDYNKLFFSLADASEPTFGFRVYDRILGQMLGRLNGETMEIVNYTAFHFIAEHSELLSERFAYVRERLQPQGPLYARMAAYASIANEFKKLKYVYLRHALSDSGYRGRFRIWDQAAFEQIYRTLNRIVAEEKEALSEIHAGLKRICEP